MYKANIHITLKESILDPKGKASVHALQNLGLNKIENARIGKYIELDIEADTAEEARDIADEACQKLLANEVMENYTLEILAAEAVAD